VSPRPYNLGRRQEQIDQVRRQVLDAARALLGEATSYTSFTADAVAKRADVSRATVYYQFGSKAGLLEALCDHLGELGGLGELPVAFMKADPLEALDAFIVSFARFWDADRGVMRRLRALATLDPDVGTVIAARDQRRASGLQAIVGRAVDAGVAAPGVDTVGAARTLTTLTSFETFDSLTGPDAGLVTATGTVQRLARAVLCPASADAQGLV
jgi:AcrR family transcriptional regulator